MKQVRRSAATRRRNAVPGEARPARASIAPEILDALELMAGERNRFVEFLRPMAPRQLLERYWESQSFVIPGGPAKLEKLSFRFDQFVQALERMPRGFIRANSVSPNGEGRYPIIEAAQARGCFDSGMTICVTELDRAVPELAALALDTKRALRLPGIVCCNCYASPAGAGFGLHFDKQSVFILQVEGSKQWRFSIRPAVEFPPEAIDALPPHRRADFRRRHVKAPLGEPDASEWGEYTLRPGDVLYLPPGTWHQGRAGEYSLAVSLTCVTYDFANLLWTLLHERLFTELDWRRNMPASIREDGDIGTPAVVVNAFMANRLAELREMVASLRPSDFATAWRAKVTGGPGA